MAGKDDRRNSTSDSTDNTRDGCLMPGNITAASVYNSITALTIEEQALVLSNYKIGDLYRMYNGQEKFDRYLEYLRENADLYMRTADALTAHRSRAAEEGGVKYESDLVRTMKDAYHNMTEQGQESFCREMAGDAGFFQKAYKAVMDTLCSAWKEYKNEYGKQQ